MELLPEMMEKAKHSYLRGSLVADRRGRLGGEAQTIDPDLLPRHDSLDRPGPVVYVAITSSRAIEVRGVVEALRGTGARVLVAATVHDLGDLESDDVLVGGVLPSHLVMPRVDLAVTAGGQGSVQCAMAAGTPLIAIPLQPEQDFNGQIVERHSAGARITMADAMSPKLAELARRILGDKSFKEGAMRVRASYARADGPGRAAEAILELVSAKRGTNGTARPREREARPSP